MGLRQRIELVQRSKQWLNEMATKYHYMHRGTIYRAANFRESGRAVSRKRHKNSRGPGMGEAELIRFIYDLAEPRWKYEPVQPGLL